MARAGKRDGVPLSSAKDDAKDEDAMRNAYGDELVLLHEIIDGLSPSVFVGLLSVDGTLIYVNRAALESIGARPEDVLGKPFDEAPWWAASKASRERLRAAIEAAANGAASRFDVILQAAGGHLLTMDFTLHPVYGDDGRIAYLVPAAYDVTQRKEAEHALRLTQFAVDHAHDSMFQIDARGRVLQVNNAACRLLGHTREALLGLPLHLIEAPLTEADWPKRWAALKDQHSLRFESNLLHATGDQIPVEVSMSYIAYGDPYEGKEYSFAYVSDIRKRKTAEERVRYLANFDPLTGLPNRRLVREQLTRIIDFAYQQNQPLTVMFLGLDRFKLVNEALGHGCGDEVLRIIANRLKASVRAIDAVGRIGADEFVVVLAGDAPEGRTPTRAMQVVMDALAQPIVIGGHELFVTCSIGAAVYPRNGSDMTALIKNSCVAMYRAKDMGRNQLQMFSGESSRGDPDRLSLEAAMRKMLQRAEFNVHYQPQVEVRSGKIAGAETLLRWPQHAEGTMSPMRFIPIAEETGLIVPMDEWVLQAACIQRRLWHEQGLELDRIGVNLSARHFHRADLAANVARVLDATSVAPHHLELEVTESMLMQDVETAIRTMAALKDIGVRISLDDFGTGYSSLSYLKRFPIDTLKIDQSFVREIATDRNSASIAEAIIAMAHRLNLTVIAEGVETEDQLAMLRDRDCDEIQGYLFCKPVPADQMTELLREMPFRTASIGA